MADYDPLKINSGYDPLGLDKPKSKTPFMDMVMGVSDADINIGEASAPVGEAIANIAHGAVGWIPEGLANAYDMGKSALRGEVPTFETGKKVREAIALPEPSQTAKDMMSPVMYPFEKLAEWGPQAGDYIYDKTDSPFLGAVTRTLVEGAPFIVPGVAGKGIRSTKQNIRELSNMGDVVSRGEQPSLPVPRNPMGPDAAKSPFNPELAMEMKSARETPPQLPPGQGFELREPPPLPPPDVYHGNVGSVREVFEEKPKVYEGEVFQGNQGRIIEAAREIPEPPDSFQGNRGAIREIQEPLSAATEKATPEVAGEAKADLPSGEPPPSEMAQAAKQPWEMTKSVQDSKTQLIAKDGKKEVGEISVIKRPDGNLEVSNVLVWPDSQRKGNATELYRRAYEEAVSQGKKLFISDDRTADAIALHEKFKAKGILRGDGEINFSPEKEPAPKRMAVKVGDTIYESPVGENHAAAYGQIPKEIVERTPKDQFITGYVENGEFVPQKAKSVKASSVSEKQPSVIDEETYLTQHGASRQDIGESALHKNIPEGNIRKRLVEHQASKDRALVEKRAQIRDEYNKLVASGEIRPPTRQEKLIRTANGMDENASVQAARRVLEKQGIEWKDTHQTESIVVPQEGTIAPKESTVKTINITEGQYGNTGAYITEVIGGRKKGVIDTKTGGTKDHVDALIDKGMDEITVRQGAYTEPIKAHLGELGWRQTVVDKAIWQSPSYKSKVSVSAPTEKVITPTKTEEKEVSNEKKTEALLGKRNGKRSWDDIDKVISDAPDIKSKIQIKKVGSQWELSYPSTSRAATQNGVKSFEYETIKTEKYPTKSKALEEMEKEMERKGKYGPEVDKIEIVTPQGATYKVWNTKETLENFKQRVTKEFPGKKAALFSLAVPSFVVNAFKSTEEEPEKMTLREANRMKR